MEIEKEIALAQKFIQEENHAYSEVEESKEPLTDLTPKILEFITPLLNLPNVLCRIVAEYMSPCIKVFLNHRKWESILTFGKWATGSCYRPTLDNPDYPTHWSEVAFEAYTDDIFLNEAFPPNTNFQSLFLTLPFPIYLAVPNKSTRRNHRYHLLYLLGHNVSGVDWIYVPSEQEERDSEWEIGRTYYGNWILRQKFHIKLLNPAWFCQSCSRMNQRLQHQCCHCRRNRLRTDLLFLNKWKRKFQNFSITPRQGSPVGDRKMAPRYWKLHRFTISKCNLCEKQLEGLENNNLVTCWNCGFKWCSYKCWESSGDHILHCGTTWKTFWLS
jgi:hypothetical protein